MSNKAERPMVVDVEAVCRRENERREENPRGKMDVENYASGSLRPLLTFMRQATQCFTVRIRNA